MKPEMRKTGICLLLLIAMFGSLAFLSGCGQQAQQIYNAKPQPSNLIVRGTVLKWVYSGANGSNPTLGGHMGNPVSGAYVTLDGNGLVMTAITDANGDYKFTGVPDGDYLLSATAEGYVFLFPDRRIVIKSPSHIAGDNTVYTVYLDGSWWFDELAYITNYSPAPGSVISNNQAFTVTFNCPMDTTTVKYSLVPQGPRAFAASQSSVNTTLTWSADSKTVTITPNGSLSSNEAYRLLLDYSYNTGSNGKYYPLNQKGCPLTAGASGPPYAEFLNYYADYRTPSGGVPSAPSGLQVVINGKITSEVDYADIYNAGLTRTIQLNWQPSHSGNISGYRVYVARSGSVLNYSSLESDSSSSNVTSGNFFSTTTAKLVKAIYGNAAVDLISTTNFPMINNTVYYKVVAFNGDGESDGTVVAAKDAVGPTLNPTPSPTPPYAGGPFSNNYIVPPIFAGETNRRYVAFTEPVDPTTIVNGNFALSGGLTVNSARFMTNQNVAGFAAIVEIVGSGNLYTGAVTMTVSGVKDLAGNPVKTGSGDTIVL